jgi:DNA-binding MurR/RpiR family transcriptional regulator
MSEAYRDLLNRIQHKFKKMSKGQKLIATYLQENYDKVAFMTASHLGQSVGVSESTVVRFANALDYDGYPKLQKALQESIKTKLTTVQRFEMSKDLDSEENIIKRVMSSDIDNIRKTIDEIDSNLIRETVQALKASRKVYVLGMRSSKILAEYFSFYLNFIMDDVHLIPSGANDPFDELINIDERDALVVFSFPRYSRRTFEVVQFAQTQKATIIGITDSLMAPLVPHVKYALTAKYNMTTFIDSLVAPMSLINSLIIALTVGEREQLKSKFDLLEEIWKQNSIYSQK